VKVAHSAPHPNLLSVKNTLLEAFKKKLLHRSFLGFGEEHLKMQKNILNLTKTHD
jgi:hypothetical protein